MIDIVKHAYQTVPFYRKLYKEVDVEKFCGICDLKKLPFVDKNMIQNQKDILLSEKYMLYPLYPELSVRRTSGSTGQY